MFNLGSNDWTTLIYNLLFLVMLVSSLLIRTSTERGNKIKQLAIWLVIIFSGVIIYNNRNTILKNFIPYVAKDTGDKRLEIQKSNDNHFHIVLKINGVNVLFMIDTGATTTSLTIKDAERVGIDVSKLIYNQVVNTANGRIYNASSEVNNIEIGSFKIDSMWVLVNKDMRGSSLLGMNFLNRLRGYEVNQDRMILYY